MLGIISDSHILDFTEKFRVDRVTFTEEDFYNLCLKFNVNSNNGFYFIVDKKGMIVNAGQNDLGYERGPKVFLQKLIKGDFFSISEFVSEGVKIGDIPWFSQVDEVIKNHRNKEYFIISLFTKICDSCFGGRVIQTLNKIENDKNESLIVYSILHRNFDRRDVPNLRAQLNISYPVIIANKELNAKWNSLIKRYREDFLTDVVFLVDKSGEIIKVADSQCKCLPSFFGYVNSLMKESK